MKKISVVFSAAFLLLGSSLAPAVASSHSTKSASMLAALPIDANTAARQQGKDDAIAWYNATNPDRAALDAEYDMARQNRVAAAPNSEEYWYWTGYQFQVGSY